MDAARCVAVLAGSRLLAGCYEYEAESYAAGGAAAGWSDGEVGG